MMQLPRSLCRGRGRTIVLVFNWPGRGGSALIRPGNKPGLTALMKTVARQTCPIDVATKLNYFANTLAGPTDTRLQRRRRPVKHLLFPAFHTGSRCFQISKGLIKTPSESATTLFTSYYLYYIGTYSKSLLKIQMSRLHRSGTNKVTYKSNRL